MQGLISVINKYSDQQEITSCYKTKGSLQSLQKPLTDYPRPIHSKYATEFVQFDTSLICP